MVKIGECCNSIFSKVVVRFIPRVQDIFAAPNCEAHFVTTLATIKTQAMLEAEIPMLEAETQGVQAQQQTIKAYLSTKLSKIVVLEAISDSSSTE